MQMWFYDSRLYLFLLLNLALVRNKETIIIRTSEELKENAFVDVLKNITNANQILQELIKNYEQLQNLYKSDEVKSNSDDNDNENDNLFKALSSKELTTKAYNGFRGITQMIFDDESVEDTEEPSSETKNNGSNIIVIESSEIKEINPNKSGNLKETSSEYNDEIEILSHTPKKMNKNKIYTTLKRVTQQTEKIKTRFSIQNKAKKVEKRHFNNHPSLRQRNDDKVIKRIVYAEVFSPDKIWQEVIHKPIKLNVHDEHVNFRKPNRNKYTTKILDEEKETKESISDSAPDDEVIEKEEIKSLILRNAYGDACLQVAVRKCFKALKAVNKAVCRIRFKCKSSFKGSFIENAKKGCIREFVNGKNKSAKVKDVEEIVFERTSKNNGEENLSKYVDLCLPHLRTETDDKKEHLRKSTKELKTINILRDRFEKACKKLSAKKCTKACRYATDKSCSKHSCENLKKRAFKKTCKSECKSAYNLYKAESNSDDDDDDDSESDDD